jgi:hypothetical protein
MTKADFIHPHLGEEEVTISGRYVFTEERREHFQGKTVLFLTGYAVVDATCCGVGGCAFCLVGGYVTQWRYRETSEGIPISEVELIEDEGTRTRISEELKQKTMCTQINFYIPPEGDWIERTGDTES